MTKQHFDYAASMVRAMLAGQWTNEPPSWADNMRMCVGDDLPTSEDNEAYTRAAQTAEAFVMFFRNHNPYFDDSRFLQACGLVAKPARTRAAKPTAKGATGRAMSQPQLAQLRQPRKRLCYSSSADWLGTRSARICSAATTRPCWLFRLSAKHGSTTSSGQTATVAGASCRVFRVFERRKHARSNMPSRRMAEYCAFRKRGDSLDSAESGYYTRSRRD